MQLKEFFDTFGVAITKAARIIDCTPHHLMGISSGKIKPSRRLARDISLYTRGAVSVDEIINHSKRAVAKPDEVQL